MIDIRHVSAGYGNKEVLTDINLGFEENSLTALIGLNGAGKSTLLGCLSKLNEISNGEIWVQGKSIKDYSFNEYAKTVSVVPQLSSLLQVDNKVRDFLVAGRTPYLSAFAVPNMEDYLRSERVAVEMGIEGFLDTEFNKLSGGEQQLILIARALVQDTPIILMDEPMSSLDLKNQSFLLRTIKKLSEKNEKTIIFSTHNPNHAFALSCDVCVIHNNHVFGHGKASDILIANVINEIYGPDICLHQNAETKYCEIVPQSAKEWEVN